MKTKPLVSVVVPCRNSEEFIEDCIHSIFAQTYKNIEVLVVDNFSTDRTGELVRVLREKYGKIRYIKKGPERTYQMNEGVYSSSGEIIYITGSDMTRDPNFIRQCVNKIREGNDAIYMSVLTDENVNYFWGRVKALERLTYIGSNYESARVFTRKAFMFLGGLDVSLIGVEEDFQHRLDYHDFRTGRIDGREYHLHEEKTLKNIFKKSNYYGRYMKSYLKKHKGKGVKFLQPARPCFFKHWRLFLKHPILTVGFIIYKIVQYGGGLCGLLK
jgi:glycosyltransferase involved in cell wall biosynthesis